MENIKPAGNIARRGRYYLFVGSIAVLGGAIAMALGILSLVLPLSTQIIIQAFFALMVLGGFIFAAVGIAAIVRALTLQKDNPLAYAVGEALTQFLDNRYTYMRNVSKRRVGYIDAVLVGPPGALVFRIVDYEGVWMNERAEWINQRRGKLRNAKTNPTRECAEDVYALRKFLSRRDLEQVPVHGIVVFTARKIELSADGPVVPVCEISTLYQIMRRDYLVDERIAPPTVRAAVDAVYDG
ncbi:MAG: NERD domain-containing protein [Chloroflexi bacterium]|nr:NERD domain-containing protein [Chloroflexota bacterium]